MRLRIRLSRTAWLILGIGIFVIAFITLYTVYTQRNREQEEISDSLLAAQNTLPGIVSEKEDWESQLTQVKSELTQVEGEVAQAESLLSQTRVSFLKSVESIEYDERLFRIARGWNLDITRLTASEPSDIDVEGINFSVTSFTVYVSGEVVDILEFITTITIDESFNTTTIEAVDIQAPEPLTEGEKGGLTEEEIEEKEKTSATIKLVIYSYQSYQGE